MSTAPLSRLEEWRLGRPGAADREIIAAGAAQLAAELDLRPPIDVDLVASSLGIDAVIRDPALDSAGCLVTVDGRVIAKVRATDTPRRQRFSVCHELSHTFFPGYHLTTQYRCHPGSSRPTATDIEALCDVAASELLLPRQPFQVDVEEAPFGINGLVEVADRYEASLEAAGHRVMTLTRDDLAFLVLEVGQKPSEAGTAAEPKLRVRSAHTSTRAAWPFMPRDKSVPDNSVFERARRGEVIEERVQVTGICAETIEAEVSARSFNYPRGDKEVERVLAVLRRISS
jgi:hypothetical protein